MKRPPEMRKKIQTLTIKLNPNDKAMYNKTIGLKPFDWLVVVFAELSFVPAFAT